jgi:hypothetical protein
MLATDVTLTGAAPSPHESFSFGWREGDFATMNDPKPWFWHVAGDAVQIPC